MEDEEGEQGANLSAAFPDPPPFYRYFSQENIEQLAQARARSVNLADLSADLKHLLPPEPPASGEYTVFGQSFKTEEQLPSLQEQGIEQLFPDSLGRRHDGHQALESGHPDLPYQLKKLARSILLSFHELVAILSTNPQEFGHKIDDLNTLFYNIHQLLNEYRPHQARESLIGMLEAQVRKKRAEIEGVKAMRDKVDKLIDNLTMQSDTMDIDEMTTEQPGNQDTERSSLERQRRIWSTLDAIEA